jgi:hypothetical protein
MRSLKSKARLINLWRELAFPIGVNLVLSVAILHLGAQVSADIHVPGSVDSHMISEYSRLASPLTEEGPGAEQPTEAPPAATATEVPPEPTATSTHTPTTIPSDTPENTATSTATPVPSATSTPPPSSTPTSTPTPKPTKTPTPTKTATPVRPPSILRFSADRMTVSAGESVVLTWETQGPGRVQIMPGFEGGLGESGSVTVQPEVATNYVLHACNKTECTDRGVMIAVKESTPTATMGPPPTPTDTPTPTPRPTRIRQLLDRMAQVWPASCPP